MKLIGTIIAFTLAGLFCVMGFSIFSDGGQMLRGILAFIIGISFIISGLKLRGKNWAIKIPNYALIGVISISLFIPLSLNSESKSDKELYQAFHQEISAKLAEMDVLFKPFADAMTKGDLFGATRIALDIKYPMNHKWSEVSSMSIPSLKNKEARKKLQEAKDAYSYAYMYKANIIEEFISFSESQNMKNLAEITNMSDKVGTLVIGGTVAMFECGSMIGVDMSTIVK